MQHQAASLQLGSASKVHAIGEAAGNQAPTSGASRWPRSFDHEHEPAAEPWSLRGSNPTGSLGQRKPRSFLCALKAVFDFRFAICRSDHSQIQMIARNDQSFATLLKRLAADGEKLGK